MLLTKPGLSKAVLLYGKMELKALPVWAVVCRKQLDWSHHLQVSRARRAGDHVWTRPDVVYDGTLKPGYHEVGSFLEHL